ncbi:MAG: hypothetical protein KatS3mg027_0065 [Bacteroidia bacterium]|nr:MAG: hypothetical protein KatS3mg027_0065 [Bacteroidia bacterium]
MCRLSKPGSVRVYHFSERPTRFGSLSFESEGAGQHLIRNLFGLAASEVYPPAELFRQDVGSYPTFSPLPQPKAVAVSFLWHFLSPRLTAEAPFVRLYKYSIRRRTVLCCPDFPPRLKNRSDRPEPAHCKVNHNFSTSQIVISLTDCCSF